MPTVPRLLAVSDAAARAGRELAAWSATLAAVGVDGLELREKSLDDRELLERARRVRSAFAAPRVLVVNGRLDVALAAGADGVHLPADGVSIARVRGSEASAFLVGRSTHELAEVEAAAAAGADYVVFGPLFPTPSKAGRLVPRGLVILRLACGFGLPVIAIGGIDDRNAQEALAAGAHGVAAIRAFASPESATALVETVLQGTVPS